MAAPSDGNSTDAIRTSSRIRRRVVHTDYVVTSFSDDDSEVDSDSDSDLEEAEFVDTNGELLSDSDTESETETTSRVVATPRPLPVPTVAASANVPSGDASVAAAPGVQQDIQWKLITNSEQDKPTIHDFIGNSGPVFTPVDAQPVEYFTRFFDPTQPAGKSLWQVLVDETNSYQELYMRNNPTLKRKSKVHLWQPVAVDEMKAFIGVILNMGILRKHSIESYWDCTNYSQDTPMFKRVFKLDTFKLILRFFHVSDRDNEPKRGTVAYDPTYKFKPVLDHFCRTWSTEYKLGPVISIDESIVGFKGRHVLVNYIRIKKHHQWGPKEYNLCDSKSGYCHQTIYHTKGMKTSDHGQPYDVCEKLMTGHTGKYHHLVVDNYYTSVPLCEKMLEKDTYVTGTIQPNRKFLPADMKKKLKDKGDICSSRKGSLLAVNWHDRKQVRLLSTHASARMVEVEKYDNTKKNIPHTVYEYNSGMGGVDLSDQMTDNYAGEFRTVKCWKKVVFHLIDRTLTNAYICYKTNPARQGKAMTHYQFIISVVEGLINGYQEPRKKVGRPSLLPPEARKTERHFLEIIPEKKRKKCAVCAEARNQGYKGTRISTWCRDCGVGLCKGNCFMQYHK